MRRFLAVALGVLIVAGGILGLMSYFSGRDSGGVQQSAAGGPGTLESTPGSPPTSGPHARRNPTSERHLDDAQLLTALELGDVVIAYPQATPPPALVALQERVSGPFDPELAAAGQMVILARRPDVSGIEALAWHRRLQASGPADPRLRAFADAWLGKGSGR
jgi:hypothetical protein